MAFNYVTTYDNVHTSVTEEWGELDLVGSHWSLQKLTPDHSNKKNLMNDTIEKALKSSSKCSKNGNLAVSFEIIHVQSDQSHPKDDQSHTGDSVRKIDSVR